MIISVCGIRELGWDRDVVDQTVVFHIGFAVIFQAGITSAYQEKPCLNPHDPDCPTTAPNKETKQVSCLSRYKRRDVSNFFKNPIQIISFHSFIHCLNVETRHRCGVDWGMLWFCRQVHALA